jgi:hypothetical protein
LRLLRVANETGTSFIGEVKVRRQNVQDNRATSWVEFLTVNENR